MDLSIPNKQKTMKDLIFKIWILPAVMLAALSCNKTEDWAKETESLPAPCNVRASVKENSINIMWDKVENESLYIVYYNIKGTQAISKSDPLTDTEYTIQDAEGGKTYEIKVRAAANNAVSPFSEIISVEIPLPPAPAAPKPVISNVRTGLGWVNLTMADFDGTCTYSIFDGTGKLSDAVLEKIKSNEDGTSEYCIGGLSLDQEYDLGISRNIDGYIDSNISSLGKIRTGKITVLTRNSSPCHLAFEWDDVAANLNWTFPSGIDALTRTYKVELAKDEGFNDIVYSFYTVNNWFRDKNNTIGTYGENNWIGQSGSPESAAKPYAAANTNICFGQLQPSTTYWFRVRNAADETVPDMVTGEEPIKMNAASGKSLWSAAMSATTQAAHSPAAGELLYQGFDDHAIQHDQINCAAGASPSGAGVTTSSSNSEYKYPWTGEWGAFSPHTGARYDNLGAAVLADSFKDGNNETKIEGQAIYEMNTDIIPSMKGWHCTKACYPQQGALKLGGSAGQKNWIMTPAFNSIEDNTNVTISCDAGAVHASSTPAKLHIKIYRKATSSVETVRTFDLPNSASILNPSGEGGFHNIVEMQNWSSDAVLDRGDFVMFVSETIKTPATNRFMIDNITITKK